MYTFLLVLLILVSLVLIAAVLMQSGKGGGLAASFGGASSSTNAFIGTRQAGNLLTRVSWWGGGIFLGLAFVLQILSTRAQAPTSVLDQTAPAPTPVAPAPAAGGAAPALPITPQGGQTAPSAVPAPSTPAPATPAPTTPAAPTTPPPQQ